MPPVPEPSEDEIRELLEPIRVAAERKRAADQDYRAAIAHARRNHLRMSHIARYTGTSQQAVAKILRRIEVAAEAKRTHTAQPPP